MKATFDNLQSFIAELRLCAGRREQSGLSAVRGTISQRAVNAGVTAFSVTSGFHDNQYVYEASIDCGQDAKGGAAAPREAEQEAGRVLREIERVCSELNVEFRGGAWVMQ